MEMCICVTCMCDKCAIVCIYIVYDLKSNLNNFYLTLQNYLFRAVKLCENNDIDKYKYSGYAIGLDSKGTFLHPSGGTGQNVIIFGADMSSSAHANNKTESILILRERFTRGLKDSILYAEKMYSINFTKTKKKFCLSLHYNEANSYLFVNGQSLLNSKQKILKL